MHARVTRYEGAAPNAIEEALQAKKGVLPTEFGQTEDRRGAQMILDAAISGSEDGLRVIGSVLLWAHATQRDADGFFTSDRGRLETVADAITSEKVDLGVQHHSIRRGDGNLRGV